MHNVDHETNELPASPTPAGSVVRGAPEPLERRRLIAAALAVLGGAPWMAACGGSAGAKTSIGGATSPVSEPTGLPPEPPAAPVTPPVGNIVQYLTSDGGLASDSGNLSAPTRDFWHKRLGMQWARLYPPGHALHGLGNWRDAAQAAEGVMPYGSSTVLTTVGQVAVINVAALVQKWMTNDANRGFYMRATGSAWPIDFHGRMSPEANKRPTLTVVTNSGTFVRVASANATWNNTTYRGLGAAASWRLSGDSQPGVLRFDLAGVNGTVVSATLSVTVKAFDSEHTGHVIGVYEADPPFIVVPENVPSPKLGLAAAYAGFKALMSSDHPDLLYAADFQSPGHFDTGFTPSAERVYNPETGTTYARGTISAGANGSLNLRREVTQGTGRRGTPNAVHEELFSQYWLYLENDFGTTVDDAVKIPAMGAQFGYWNPVGYWQQTTGNGGSPGTGLKVDNGGASNYEFQGHSVRFLTGVAPTAADEDPYDGWFGVAIYPYNLDQGGPFPSVESFRNVAIRKGAWYCFDIRVRQNSMSGSQDSLGNYATANPDGVYEVWLNGHPVYSRSNYRWRRHAEFGVQGLWLDVYHGGVLVAPSTMHYRVDRVAVAKRYIGPPAQ